MQKIKKIKEIILRKFFNRFSIKIIDVHIGKSIINRISRNIGQNYFLTLLFLNLKIGPVLHIYMFRIFLKRQIEIIF
jgi:hypothetical protein